MQSAPTETSDALTRPGVVPTPVWNQLVELYIAKKYAAALEFAKQNGIPESVMLRASGEAVEVRRERLDMNGDGDDVPEPPIKPSRKGRPRRAAKKDRA